MDIPGAVLLQDPVVIGAAVRLAAGASSVDDLLAQAQGALISKSGVSRFVWSKISSEILDAAETIITQSKK